MEVSEFLATVRSLHASAEQRELFFQHTEALQLGGRGVRVAGRELVSFSSCSYLGLEHHPALIEGTIEATRKFGTQFSSSRGYLSAPLYPELEAALGEIFDGHVLVTASTSIGHQVALPVLVTEKDAIVLDHQVHHSVHIAANLARQGG
ncbi:MAG: 7-keto-8-aminopelargonate synthetase-like enzyme, partial [Myxococcota bacterium]